MVLALLNPPSPASAQKPDASVYRLRSPRSSGLADRVVESITAELGRLYTVVDSGFDRPAVIHAKLRTKSDDDLVFVIGDRQIVSELARIDLNFGDLPLLKVDFVNARAAAVPVYVFALASTLDTLRSAPRRPVKVAYGVTDKTKGFDKDEATFVFRSALGPQTQVLAPTTNARDLVRLLVADERDLDRADFVAIYDEEPSLLLNDFLAAYRPYKSSYALKLYFFPAQFRSLGNQLNFQGPSGSTSSFTHYDNLLFHPDFKDLIPSENADGLLTVLSPTLPLDALTDAPVVLSNLRIVGGDAASLRSAAKVRQIVSYAYLDALMSDEATNRCNGKPVPVFESYLLKALLSDPDSLVKSLSLWSNLKLSAETKNLPASAAIVERKDLIENMVVDRLQTLRLNAKATDNNKSERVKIDFAKLAGQLSPTAVPPSIRQQFSSDDATAFNRAVANVQSAAGPNAASSKNLRTARGALVQLLLKEQGPACVLQGLGLFGAKGYDPFFYLGVIDSKLAMQAPD